jgi:hypothetical protein
VARAKQTARAEARRRNRLAARPIDTEGLEPTDEIDEAPSAAASTRGRPAGPQSRPTVSSGVLGSFRAAYRRPDIRSDLAALPRLLLFPWFLVALILTVVGAVAYQLYPGYSGAIFLLQFLTYPPAIAPIFVAGFFAPRASYLLGLFVALFDGIVYWVFLATLPPGSTATGSTVVNDIGTYLFAAVSWGVTGIFFASGAAWYRRFLQLTSPRRPATGRGNQAKSGRQTATASRRR